MTERSLAVWWDTGLVGHLTQDRNGDIAFAYDCDWLAFRDAQPISRSLPLRPEPFDRHVCRAFFGGLLPEADQRSAVAAKLGVSPANVFALLDRLGGDVAGALTLLPIGEHPLTEAEDSPQRLNEIELGELLDQLPDRPFLAGSSGLRLSLAGAQAKLPVVLIDGEPGLPASRQATTHIIKPEIPRFPGSVANEAWCMQLAAAIGIETASAEARQAAGRPYLLVTRYDRRQIDDRTLRLHQEDACQALAVMPERKYASEGGPAFRDLFALTREYVRQPARDVLTLVDTAILNLAIGNADAHGKNFSYLLDDEGPRLAPLYDLLATVAWPNLDARLAMRIGRAGTIDELNPDEWKRFVDEAEVTWPFLRRRVAELTTMIENVAPDITDPNGDMIERTIQRSTMIRRSAG